MLDWLKRILPGRRAMTADKILKYPDGKRIYADFHGIRKNLIDQDAAKVISRLQQYGYKAYVVGGSVRDLLLGRQPKDYDVVTNARPNDVRRIFANSRLIGRRFRIVHIVFRGNKIIEVSTARSLPKSRFKAKHHDELYLKSDNQYGSFKEDASRRDFTINALCYDVRNETIIDYTGGYEDIQQKIIRIIGDEDVSLPEDPVRMLRASKFASLLDFTLDPKLAKGIRKYRKLIRKAAQARLHEEYNKIFRTGQSEKIFAGFLECGLFEAMFPELFRVSLNGIDSVDHFRQTALSRRLAIADRMILEHEDINTNIYYALLCADIVRDLFTTDRPKSADKLNEKKLKEALEPLEKELGLTRKESERLVDIYNSQHFFQREVTERKGWVRDFKNRDYFLEAFIFYKIDARANNRDDLIQKALFWEIDLRQKLPNAIRKVVQRPIQPQSPLELGEELRDRSGQGHSQRHNHHTKQHEAANPVNGMESSAATGTSRRRNRRRRSRGRSANVTTSQEIAITGSDPTPE